jgi:hypothetical protein
VILGIELDLDVEGANGVLHQLGRDLGQPSSDLPQERREGRERRLVGFPMRAKRP